MKRTPAFVRRPHRTYSLYLPMRDGVRLAVQVVLPADLRPGERLPVVLEQSRYWRAMQLRSPLRWFMTADQLDPNYRSFKPYVVSRGYALVQVDVRGTGASFGCFTYPWHPETVRDSYEIVDWITAQPWCSGRVGGMGVSYLGTTAELLAACGHPAVKATAPLFNHPDAYTDIAFPGGLFNQRFLHIWGQLDTHLDRNRLPDEFGRLMRLMIRGVMPVDGARAEAAALLAQAIAEHCANGDVYQAARHTTFRDEVRPELGGCLQDMLVERYLPHIAASGAAIYAQASWMDAGTAAAALRRHQTLENVRRTLIGAWDHGGTSGASPYAPALNRPNPPLPDQWAGLFDFFDAYLKDGPAAEAARAHFQAPQVDYFTLGEEQWHTASAWPPPGVQPQRWFLAPDGGLSLDAPQDLQGADHFRVDFAATSGRHNRWWEMGPMERQTVLYLDRAAAARHMLTYLTPPLPYDLEISGDPELCLYAASSHTDGAFLAYLEEVDEAGRVTYLTEGQLRALHRRPGAGSPYRVSPPVHSFRQADALPLAPGEVACLHFKLHPISALVRRGRRLRLGLAGADADTFSRLPVEGTPEWQVQRRAGCASYLDIPVRPRS